MDLQSVIGKITSTKMISKIERDGSTLSVIEKGSGRERVRLLRYNSVVFSTLRLSSIYTDSYWDYFLPLPSIFERPRVLVLGLGGGTVPYQMESVYGHSISIDVVEIDPDMVTLSHSFLPKRLKSKIIISDAYSYLLKSDVRYDVIVVDLYIDDVMPDRFFTESFIELCSSRLNERGVIGINLARSYFALKRIPRFLSNLKRVFGSYGIVIPLMVPGNNIIIAARGIKIEEVKREIKDGYHHNKENAHVTDGYRDMQIF